MVSRRSDKSVEALEAEIAELENRQPVVEEEVQRTAPPVQTQVEDEDLTSEERTWKKRFGDLRRHSQKEKKDLTDRLTALEAKLSERPSTDLPVTKDEMKKWAQDNPKAAALIRAIAQEESGSDSIRTKLGEIDKLNEQISKDKAEAKILKVHPDFYEIVDDEAFHDWAETQPSFIQDRVYENDSPEETIWAINLYKEQNGKTKNTLTRELSKGVKPRGRTEPNPQPGKGRFTESMVEKMSIQEYEANQEEISKCIRENPRAFYDISGGAR